MRMRGLFASKHVLARTCTCKRRHASKAVRNGFHFSISTELGRTHGTCHQTNTTLHLTGWKPEPRGQFTCGPFHRDYPYGPWKRPIWYRTRSLFSLAHAVIPCFAASNFCLNKISIFFALTIVQTLKIEKVGTFFPHHPCFLQI
jgi:hypothetical protein